LGSVAGVFDVYVFSLFVDGDDDDARACGDGGGGGWARGGGSGRWSWCRGVARSGGVARGVGGARCRGGFPDADDAFAGGFFEGNKVVVVSDVGRVSDGLGIASGDEFGVDEGSISKIDVTEKAVIGIDFGSVFDEIDDLSCDELAIVVGGLSTKVLVVFRGINTDVAKRISLTVNFDFNGIAVNDADDTGLLAFRGRLGCRRACRRLGRAWSACGEDGVGGGGGDGERGCVSGGAGWCEGVCR